MEQKGNEEVRHHGLSATHHHLRPLPQGRERQRHWPGADLLLPVLPDGGVPGQGRQPTIG